MIEFQLTVYMCSYCTRVHNAAHSCIAHEMEEHDEMATKETSTAVVDDPRSQPPTTSAVTMPFSIGDEVKPTPDHVDEVQPESSKINYDTLAISELSAREVKEGVDGESENFGDDAEEPDGALFIASTMEMESNFERSNLCPSSTNSSEKQTEQRGRLNISHGIKVNRTRAMKTCPHCEKMVLANHYARHKRTHSMTDNPYKCGKCSKAFADTTNWRRHVKKCV